MTLSKKQRATDKELAEIINNLEMLQLRTTTNEVDEKATRLINDLYALSQEYKDRIRIHSYDIKDCLNGLIKTYAKEKRPVPYYTTHFLLLNDEKGRVK